MKTIIFVPIKDYFLSRRKLLWKFLIPLLICALVFIVALLFNVSNPLASFGEFINIQISIIAILLSFSVAIITILVSADNSNIRSLKQTKSSLKNYRPVHNKQLSLFQVMLSSICYNAVLEVIYLIMLIGLSLVKEILPVGVLKYLTAFCVFLIIHILYVLLESVAQMYLTFWENKDINEE